MKNITFSDSANFKSIPSEISAKKSFDLTDEVFTSSPYVFFSSAYYNPFLRYFDLSVSNQELFNNNEQDKLLYERVFDKKLSYNISDFDFNNNAWYKQVIANKVKFGEDFNFDNSYVNTAFGSDNRFDSKITFSNSINFHNNYFGKTYQPNFSSGIFPFTEYIGAISNEEYTYEVLDSLIENRNATSYWFDNSVPSRDDYFQTKVIAWGYKSHDYQLSMRMPSYPLNFEFQVPNMWIEPKQNFELNFFPLTDEDFKLNLETNYISDQYTLDVQFGKGYAYTYGLNLETNIAEFGQWNNLLKFEFERVYKTHYNLNLETNYVYTSDNLINLEINPSDLGYYYKTNFELAVNYAGEFELPLEFETGFGNVINFETTVHLPTNYNLDFELERVYLTTDDLNLETQIVYHTNENLNAELIVETLNKHYENNLELFVNEVPKHLNFEVQMTYSENFNTDLEVFINEVPRYLNFEFDNYAIDKNYALNMQTEMIYHDVYNTNLEVLIDNLTSKNILNIEVTGQAESESDISLEFARSDDTNTNYQTYIIPFGYKNDDYQVTIKAIVDERDKTNFEMDIINIQKRDDTNFELYVDINEELLNNLEFDIFELNKTYQLNFETDIPTLNKDYVNNFETQVVYHDVGNLLNIELYNEINYKNNLNLELFGAYITQSKNLDLEFMRSVDVSTHYQGYVVPINFAEDNYQVNVNAIIDERDRTNLEFFASIEKEYPLNFETQIVYHKDYSLDLEVYSEIETKDYINLETYVEIETEDKLNFETKVSVPTEEKLNIETYVTIEMDENFNLETFVSGINKDYGINIETFVDTVNRYLNIEVFVNTVNKTLGLEFDVLDLVYYVLKQGYNIVPWGYADGIGVYDSNIPKNWNKDNTSDTSVSTGLLNQLIDKGLTIPEKITFSDKKQDNFGIIIPGKMNQDLSLSDKFLYYESKEDYTIVMGKKKKEAKEVIHLTKGKNLIIWDGARSTDATFNNKIKPFIEDKLIYAMIWDQRIANWKTLINEDHDLYFEYLIDNQVQPMPYILVINVSDDCEFEILR